MATGKERIFTRCFNDQILPLFSQFVSEMRLSPPPKRYYLPLSLKSGNLAALIIDLDASGNANTLFFNPRGDKADDQQSAQLFIAALREIYNKGQDYRTTKEFAENNIHSGEWSLSFLNWAAQSYAKMPLQKFPDLVTRQFGRDLTKKPEDLRADYVALLENYQTKIAAASSGQVEEEKVEEQLQAYEASKKDKPLPSPSSTASSVSTVTVKLTPPPARTGVTRNPAQLLADKIFSTKPAAGITRSEYEFFKAQTLGEINQVIRQVQPALSPSLSLLPPPSSAILLPASEGSVRVGKHTLPRALENNSLKLKKFTVVEFNKTEASVDSKLIFEKEAEELMKSKSRFTDLTADEKKILLAVVDKQIEDSIQALKGAGRSVMLSLNEKMSPLMKDTYEEYCRAMAYELKDVDKSILVTGKEVPQGLQATKASIVEYRDELSEMIKKESSPSLRLSRH